MAHRVAPEAEAELERIWYFTAVQSNSIDIADRLIVAITDQFVLLSRFPEIGRKRDHDLRPGLRSLAVGNYVIFYKIEADDALILHVIHGSRDIQSMLQ